MKQASIKLAIINLLMAIGVLFFGSFVFMKLFNWFIPSITGWNEISYWMAFGVTIVTESLLLVIEYKINGIYDDLIEDSIYDSIVKQITVATTYGMMLGVGALVQLGV